MRVVATRRGFYGKLREPGQEFEIPDLLFASGSKWMKRVAATAPESVVAETPQATETAVAAEPVIKKRRGRKPKVSE